MDVNKLKNPDFVVAVFINEAKEIEDYELIQNFISGEFGNDVECNSDYYDHYALTDAGVLTLCEDANSLYHVYLKIHWMGEGEDSEVDLEIIHLLKVKDNYREHLDKENDYLEQLELSSKDDELHFEDSNSFGIRFYNTESGLNYHEFKRIIKIIAQKDIYLAHRMAFNDELIKELGDNYNMQIMSAETRKLGFRRFLKRNPNIELRYDESGYYITNINYRLTSKDSIYISYENINNLEDDIMQLSNREILDHFFNQYAIMKAFEDNIKEDTQ